MQQVGPGVVGEVDGQPGRNGGDADERLRLSDVGKLVRRAQRTVVGAARVEDTVTFRRLFVEHLGPDA